MITSLLLAFALQSPQSVTDIQARIPQTPFVVSLELSGWKENPSPGELLGNKLLLAGTISPAGSVLTLLVEANQPPKSPQYWRDRFAVPGLPFDVDFTPCVDSTVELAQGLVQSDFHAYFATRKHVLDLHISRMSEKQEAFPRAEFERIVKSLRVLLLRRGWAEDYPDSIGAPMTFASVLGVDQKGWKEGYLARHAEEWSAQFANAEFLHYSNAPFEEQLAAYDKALALITKLENPDPKTRFALAMLHDGRSLAFYDASRFADSIAPIEMSLAILTELNRKQECAGLAYNLACSHALTEHRAPALAALKQAIELDPRYREHAAQDSDFASLANEAEFKKLLEPPVPPQPPKQG
jgi:hypothetical protein